MTASGTGVWVLVVGALAAQSTTQSIQGLVTDPSGSAIPGARVVIINDGTGISATRLANASGHYSFPFVPVGNYLVTCDVQGFRTVRVRGLRVETAAQVRQDFRLEAGPTAEMVDVKAPAVLLNKENPSTGSVVDRERIRLLPLGGNLVHLAVFVPGVQFGERIGRASGSLGFPIPGQSFAVSANGQREYHQTVSLDGVDLKDPRIHVTNFVPAVESVEEFRIQTNAYSAEYGFGGGARVSITTRSGTNLYHGTAGEFLRNDKLDAEDYFLNFERPAGQRLPKDSLRANSFGVALSGPLIRNRTFWAFNSEYRRIRSSTVQSAFFPHDRFRNGDFSELLAGAFNPATGRLFRAPIVIYDPLTGDPFQDNVIPRSRLHAGALNVIEKFLPRAEFRQADPLDFTARRAVPQPINTNQYFGRVDHYFTARDRVFARLAMDRSGFDSHVINPHFPVFLVSRVTNLATNWIHIFHQRTVNELRVGSNVSNNRQDTLHSNGNFDIDSLGIGPYQVANDGNRKLRPHEQGVPNLGFTIGEQGYGQDQMDTIQAGDHFSLALGQHNLKAGAEAYRISMERWGAVLAQGRLTFGANETGYNFASLLLGYPARSETPLGAPATFPRATRFGTYFEDDWKLSPRVTVSLGLRFDYIGNPRDARGMWRTVDFPGVGAAAGRGRGFQAPDGQVLPTMYPEPADERGAVKLWKQDVRFFMPRLGIAYRPAAGWVLRAGAGWFDNINHLNTWTILNTNPPMSGVLQFDSITDAAQRIPAAAADGQTYTVQTRRFRAGAPVLTLSDPFLTRTGGRATALAVNTVYVPPDAKDGDVWKWSFDIQRELPFHVALNAGYAGSKGTHVGNSIGNYNDALPASNTNVQARRPYQRLNDPASPERGIQGVAVIRYLDTYGESFYHALQARLDRRFERGMAFGLAYTFSKAHGDGENGGQEPAGFQNPRDRLGSRGRFRFDQTHNLVAHYVWELPGRGLAGPLRHMFGGWQVNGIVSIRSGFPFTAGQGAADLNVGSGPVRPDLVGDPGIHPPSRALWFNPRAFRRVTCNLPARQDLCHYGSAGYNLLEAPGQKNLEASVFRHFTLSERVRLQFRTEFLNALNTPYFGEPRGIGFTANDAIVPDGVRMGEILSLRTPMRQIQFGLKLHF